MKLQGLATNLYELKIGDTFHFAADERRRIVVQKGKTESYCPLVGDTSPHDKGEEVYHNSTDVVLFLKGEMMDEFYEPSQFTC